MSNNDSLSLASAAAVTSQPCQAPTGVAVGRLTTSARVRFTASSSDSGGYAVAYTPTGGAAQTASAAARPVNPRGPLASNCGSDRELHHRLHSAYTQRAGQPDRARRCKNTAGPQLLAAVCTGLGTQLLTFSSNLVFDGWQATPCRESDPVAPLGCTAAAS